MRESIAQCNNCIYSPKSLCEKTFKQDLLDKSHSRTVLSIEDESKCWAKLEKKDYKDDQKAHVLSFIFVKHTALLYGKYLKVYSTH